jgi:hypothetical protein
VGLASIVKLSLTIEPLGINVFCFLLVELFVLEEPLAYSAIFDSDRGYSLCFLVLDAVMNALFLLVNTSLLGVCAVILSLGDTIVDEDLFCSWFWVLVWKVWLA